MSIHGFKILLNFPRILDLYLKHHACKELNRCASGIKSIEAVLLRKTRHSTRSQVEPGRVSAPLTRRWQSRRHQCISCWRRSCRSASFPCLVVVVDVGGTEAVGVVTMRQRRGQRHQRHFERRRTRENGGRERER